MPCRELDPSTYSGALSANWNAREDAKAFYYAIKMGKMTAEQAREDIGCSEHEADIMRTLCDPESPYELQQVNKIIAKRSKTLLLFDRLVAQNNPVEVKVRRRSHDRYNPACVRIRPVLHRSLVASPGAAPVALQLPGSGDGVLLSVSADRTFATASPVEQVMPQMSLPR